MSRPTFASGIADDPTHPAWMEVDLDALAHNYGLIQSLVGPELRIIASVKGNGYGVGIVEVARRGSGSRSTCCRAICPRG